MMGMLKKIFQQRELITYFFWGVMTTIVNYVVYFCCTRFLCTSYFAGNLTAWVIAVMFAYVTNKVFVFCTPWDSKNGILRELFSFASGRVISLATEMVILYLFIDLMNINDIVVKLFSNVLVIILNYIFAKLFVFQKNREG